MSFRDFPLYLMETLKCWSSLHEYIFVFMFLITVSKGSACEAPSTPECFKRNTECSGRSAEKCSVYICEWSMNTTDSNVTFDLYVHKKKFRSNKKTCELIEERLITSRPVNISVIAHVGNSSCSSTRRSVTLKHTVKYEAPQNISMSWLKNNLNLSWPAAEKHPALAEIRFRRDEHPTESWEKRTTNTFSDDVMYHVIVVSLLKDSAFQVQIRHRSTKVLNPLWSDWSPVVTVPAELEQKPEVDMTTRLLNGTREVTLTWKPMPHAAAVRGVTYSLEDTQSSNGCPCEKNRHPINKTKHTIYVSLSAVNISVIARNAAGYSPPEIRQVAAEPAADLKICDKTLLHEKLNHKTCLEWYELQDGDSRPENVNIMKKKQREQIRMNITDYVRYLYFEHRCDGGRPQTVKMCLFYQKEGVPLREPQDFRTFSETHTSANLSWKAIPSVDQRGFLTHYSLCSVKISSQDEPKECRNISASLTKHRLENLTPGAKYNISLVGVTRVGQGPEATVTISTSPENPVNVWWSLGLLLLFFFITTMGTCILKRIKNKIFPPVPTPVIPDFSPYQAECQECLERKEEVEEVHELTLHQYPESRSVPEDAEETTVLTGEWDDGTDEDVENERGDSRMSGGTSDECVSPGSTDEALRSSRDGEMTDLEQVDNEIAMLIYKNGLVFDVKTDSP
ncbi:interleukin-12 receptor subunit beta-1 isoform X1 [Sebastes umbrosus]|uniref:interleukin-12 receptor subunit beta-1 isoform X1 n=2 Tax=Sebastes umbrosus TaxID=72105 RepID=UPI0018A121AE|nr:interleukin-12 receptor subunit beta-1 isoform X1 [Sebastes umbrosus]